MMYLRLLIAEAATPLTVKFKPVLMLPKFQLDPITGIMMVGRNDVLYAMAVGDLLLINIVHEGRSC